MKSCRRRGLDKLGDAYLPGSDQLPSFSSLGCSEYLPKLLETMEPGDREAICRLLVLCDRLPASLIRVAVRLVACCCWLPGVLGGSGLRLFHIGTKGVVMTLYYSGYRGTRSCIRAPLKVLDCQLVTYTDDLEV